MERVLQRAVEVAVRRAADRLEIGETGDRGDVPGWVLVTLMTAGLVLALWAVADTALTDMFNQAMAEVRSR